MAAVDREMRIADLAIHGWEPVREIPSATTGYGVYNRVLQVGFRVVGLGTPKQDVRTVDPNRFTPCEWDDVQIEVLDAIEERLGRL